jgi:GNAT superfamily N-acetyltransferase
MTAITIEKVNRQNFDQFLTLIEKFAEYEHLTPPDADARARLRADGLSDNPDYEAYLGYLEGIPVAYVTFYVTYSTFLARPTLFLEDIFILEEYRHAGIGRKMFEFCKDAAAKRNCGRIDWMVLTWNKPAIDFYEKCGGKRMDWYAYRIEREGFLK